MRHTIILFSSTLFVACSFVSGGKLGSSSDPVSSHGIADGYEAAVETPRQLKSPEHDAESILEKLPELEKKLADGTLTNAEDIHWLRISWLTYFGAMERGGEPRCAPCMNNPKYKELKSKAPEINARLAKLEKAVGNCTYGYRMSNGDLLPMTLDWSEDDWKKIEDKAMPPGYRQKERCWTDDKDGKEGKPHGWAY